MKTNKRLERNGIASSSQPRPGLLAMTTSFIVVTGIIFCALTFLPEQAFAGASVTVSSGTWAIGAKKASTATTSSSFTVTNAASGGTENITISVGNSASWTPSATSSPGNNQFVLQKDNPAGQVITGTAATLVTGLTNNGTSALTLYFTTPTAGSTGEGVQQTITVTLTATNWELAFVCGDNLVKTHTAGTVAPVTKTVTYGTTSYISKCWITRNLGASQQATSLNDATEASAGWYWQYSLAQGFKHDGTTRTPSTALSGTVDSGAVWAANLDPCMLLLGSGWRLPTYAEWSSASTGWGVTADIYNSVLKLHVCGYIDYPTGNVSWRGTYAYWWSCDLGWNDAMECWCYSGFLGIGNAPGMYGDALTSACSVRCLRD